MIYKHIQELKVGSLFAQYRQYAGMVLFVVESIENGRVSARSRSLSGYDFEFGNSYFVECDKRGKHFFTSLEEGNAFSAAAKEKRIVDFVEEYRNDPAAFINFVIKQAYESDLDPEYGDYERGQAIKQLAAIHFPNIEL